MAYFALPLLFCLDIMMFIRVAGHGSTGISHDIRQAGFDHLQDLSFSFYDRRPTGWLVAAIATRQVALAPNLWATVLLVAAAGALGSTMANLNDYHLFTLLLRHRRVSAVRNTRAYRYSARWFARAPMAILVIFNIVPIPVDVVRMLAATARYRLGRFAAANYVGRFIRYGLLAGLAYATNLSAAWASIIMLAGAAALAVGRAVPALRGRGKPRAEAS